MRPCVLPLHQGCNGSVHRVCDMKGLEPVKVAWRSMSPKNKQGRGVGGGGGRGGGGGWETRLKIGPPWWEKNRPPSNSLWMLVVQREASQRNKEERQREVGWDGRARELGGGFVESLGPKSGWFLEIPQNKTWDTQLLDLNQVEMLFGLDECLQLLSRMTIQAPAEQYSGLTFSSKTACFSREKKRMKQNNAYRFRMPSRIAEFNLA